jgi:DNA-binding PadR family transcriptional regulator
MSVRYTLLGLLTQQPRYGYELRAAFIALAGGADAWEVKPAQIYTTLNRMTESGLVDKSSPEEDGRDEKVVFSITDSGRIELAHWLSQGSLDDPQQDEFFLKLMLSLELPNVDGSHLIQTQRSALFQELHRVTTLRTHLDPRTELARILLMDKAIMHLEADLRWLDMIESRLDEVQKQPLPRPEMHPRGRPQKHKLF